ncbi:MAG: hypothetical protein Q9202_007129 [Teloschistes flavicans]
MGLPDKPIELGWEAQLDYHKFHALNAIHTRDITIFKFLLAQSVAQQVDHIATLKEVMGDDNTAKALNDLNVENCNSNDAAIVYYQGEVESKKDKNLSQDDWENLLEAQEQRAIQTVTETIHATTLKAKKVIGAIKPEARKLAANVWTEGVNIVMQVFNQLSAQLSIVLSKVADFLKGLFPAMKNACIAVDSAVKTGINFIMGTLSSADDPTHVGWTKFTGFCNWPTTIAITNISIGVTYIAKNLVDAGVRIRGQSITTSEKGGPTTTSFELLVRANFDAKKVFTKAVDDLGNDGHYIPLEPVSAPPEPVSTPPEPAAAPAEPPSTPAAPKGT